MYVEEKDFNSDEYLENANGFYTVDSELFADAKKIYKFGVYDYKYLDELLIDHITDQFNCDKKEAKDILSKCSFDCFYVPYFKYDIKIKSIKFNIKTWTKKDFEKTYDINEMLVYVYDNNYHIFTDFHKDCEETVEEVTGNEVVLGYKYLCGTNTVFADKDATNNSVLTYCLNFKKKLKERNNEIETVTFKYCDYYLCKDYDVVLVPIIYIVSPVYGNILCMDCASSKRLSGEFLNTVYEITNNNRVEKIKNQVDYKCDQIRKKYKIVSLVLLGVFLAMVIDFFLIRYNPLKGIFEITDPNIYDDFACRIIHMVFLAGILIFSLVDLYNLHLLNDSRYIVIGHFKNLATKGVLDENNSELITTEIKKATFKSRRYFAIRIGTMAAYVLIVLIVVRILTLFV